MKINQLEQLDHRFEQFLDGVLVDYVETELTPEKRDKRRARADKDDLEFCKIYFSNIFDLDWNDAHRFIAECKVGMFTVSGFRKCGKSAVTYVAKAIKPIALGIGGIININCRTLEIADERTAALKRLMFRNALLLYDYEVELQQDLKGNYIINNTYLISGSVKTGLRSLVDEQFKRIMVSINDDLYNKNTVTSLYDNEKVVDFIESEVKGQLEDDGLSITMGNSISENCPIVTLKEKHPDKHFSLPALNEKDESTWPSYRTTEQWQIERKDIELTVWLGEFMDKPAIKGDVFDINWLRGINLNLTEIIASISALDPSHGKSPSACDKGLATVGLTKKHEVVGLDMFIRKESYAQVFDYVDALRNRVPHWKVLLFENDFNQWGFAAPYYQDWVRRTTKTLPIVQHLASQLATENRGSDKDSRILNLVHPHQTGMFLYDESILKSPDFLKYRTQYLAFGKDKEKLDGLDALATAYIMIFRYAVTGKFKALKKRTFVRTQSFFRKN